MPRVTGVSSLLLRPPSGLSPQSLAGGVAPVAPVVRRLPSAAPEPTVAGIARRTAAAASLPPRTAAGRLAGPEGFARHGRLPREFQAPGPMRGPRQATHAAPLWSPRPAAEALLAARSGALLQRRPAAD
ncbi:hypothetical protein [Acidovorax sp. PRC11]|uniref:hypothetical protein n=1 Tax=Acidovorax sp. PRC11 TaxID=2962592 RepID=UPI0028814BEF|nr:hypothetical protein [Acidovorax sp. PRC11]MDT0138708.1 hypothetical protein [Acidovorax sp. PRC11]